MTTVIMSVYETEESFLEVRDQLLAGGFEPAQVQSLRSGPPHEGGFVYQESAEGDPAHISRRQARELLTDQEFEAWEVEDALTKVAADQYLLVVRSGDELAGRGVEILNEEPAVEQRREDSY